MQTEGISILSDLENTEWIQGATVLVVAEFNWIKNF